MFLFDKFNVCFEYYIYMKKLGLKFLLLFALCIFALQPAFAIKIGLDDGIKQTYIGSSKKVRFMTVRQVRNYTGLIPLFLIL